MIFNCIQTSANSKHSFLFLSLSFSQLYTIQLTFNILAEIFNFEVLMKNYPKVSMKNHNKRNNNTDVDTFTLVIPEYYKPYISIHS